MPKVKSSDINLRRIKDTDPDMEDFFEELKKKAKEVSDAELIIAHQGGVRGKSLQNLLKKLGKSQASYGQSLHNYGQALDVQFRGVSAKDNRELLKNLRDKMGDKAAPLIKFKDGSEDLGHFSRMSFKDFKAKKEKDEKRAGETIYSYGNKDIVDQAMKNREIRAKGAYLFGAPKKELEEEEEEVTIMEKLINGSRKE